MKTFNTLITMIYLQLLSCLYGKDYMMAEIQLSSYSGLRSLLDALNVPTTSFVEISPSCDLSTLHG